MCHMCDVHLHIACVGERTLYSQHWTAGMESTSRISSLHRPHIRHETCRKCSKEGGDGEHVASGRKGKK
jgi:hypothetical protein